MINTYDRLYAGYMGNDWLWAKAVAQHESGQDVNAPWGDGGLAVGMFQMHPDFWKDYGPICGDRRCAHCSTQAFAQFWHDNAALGVVDKVGTYNHGADGWKAVVDKPNDPYVVAVLAIHNDLVKGG